MELDPVTGELYCRTNYSTNASSLYVESLFNTNIWSEKILTGRHAIFCYYFININLLLISGPLIDDKARGVATPSRVDTCALQVLLLLLLIIVTLHRLDTVFRSGG